MTSHRVPHRWYWIVAASLVMVCTLMSPVLLHRWFTCVRPWTSLAWWVGMVFWSGNLVWTFGVVPYLDSGDTSCSCGASTPQSRLQILRQMLWAPAVVLSLCIVLLTAIFPYVMYSETGRWVWGLRPWMSLFIPVTWIAMVYARSMGRVVEQRYRSTAEARGECFVCGYSQMGIDSDRCPECGTRQVNPATQLAAQAQAA